MAENKGPLHNVLVLVLVGLTGVVMGRYTGLSERLPGNGPPRIFDEAYRIVTQNHVRAKELDPAKLQHTAVQAVISELNDDYAHFREKNDIVPPVGNRGNEFVQVKQLEIHQAPASPSQTVPEGAHTGPQATRTAEPSPTGQDGNIAYLKIGTFDTQDISAVLEMNIREIIRSKPHALVIDLRENRGGWTNDAVRIAGIFLPENGVVTHFIGNDGERTPLTSDSPLAGKLLKLPVVLLVNGNTASAAELFAGALRDWRKTPLVGEKTFGKGIAQQSWTLSDGSELKMTTNHWLTPSEHSIHGKGFEPDAIVTVTKEQISSGRVQPGTPGKDPQLDKAIELLTR